MAQSLKELSALTPTCPNNRDNTKPIDNDVKNGKEQVQDTNFIRPGDRFNKNEPKNVVGKTSEYILFTYHKNLEDLMNHGNEGMDAHTIYHLKGDVIWALGPKAMHEIMRGQWGRELKDVNIQKLLKLFKKTFLPSRNVFHSRAQFFTVKQEDGDTLDVYWKRLVTIERKCEFNRITPEEIIIYKFAATINDKKARDQFVKGPLELRTVLETIELDNYDRKYGDKNQDTKSRRRFPQTAPLTGNKLPSLSQYGSWDR